MVRKNSTYAHGPGMKNGLVTEAAEAAMTMNDLNLFADDDIPEYGKEGEDGGHGRITVDDEEWDMIDLKSIGKISYSLAALVRMSDDYDLVTAIYEFLGGKIKISKLQHRLAQGVTHA